MKKFPFLHLVLFILTLLSTLTVGAVQSGVDVLKEPGQIYKGIPFAVTLMVILLSHELSHYFTSKRHGVKATLPYFIPAPTIIGTFGAFIKMKSPIVTRQSLIDIGASGPIAGFIISVIATIVGLNMSEVVTTTQTAGALNLGDSILFSFLSRAILGVTSHGHDVLLNPVAFAGWIGLFVTSINLIPVGQLDGGHITYHAPGREAFPPFGRAHNCNGWPWSVLMGRVGGMGYFIGDPRLQTSSRPLLGDPFRQQKKIHRMVCSRDIHSHVYTRTVPDSVRVFQIFSRHSFSAGIHGILS